MAREYADSLVGFIAKLLPAVALLSLTGCNPSPEIAACETFIKAKILTPGSLKVISASSLPSNGEGIRGLKTSDAIRLVTIEYDAANLHGAPIRNTDACVFPLTNGQLPSASTMESEATSAGLSAKLHANGPLYTHEDTDSLIEKADALSRGERLYDCCIPDPKHGSGGR